MEKKFFRAKEAANYIGVSVSTFYRMRDRSGDFPTPVKYSEKTVLYIRDELDEFIESKRLAA